MQTTAKISYRDIERLADHDDFGGFGYLGNSERNHDTDSILARTANDQGLTLDEVFLWANSRMARHFADCMLADLGELLDDKHLPTHDGLDLQLRMQRDITRWLPSLKAEVAA